MEIKQSGPVNRPAPGAIKAGAKARTMISVVFAAGLVAAGLVSVCAARTGKAITSETEAFTTVPATSIERSGTLIVHELLF